MVAMETAELLPCIVCTCLAQDEVPSAGMACGCHVSGARSLWLSCLRRQELVVAMSY